MIGQREKKNHMQETIEISKQAFYAGLEKREGTWAEFLAGQLRFIRKRWWFFQFLVLLFLWGAMYFGNVELVLRREAAALMPIFGILTIPELWRNRHYHSIEVENAACFTMRQIYAARMTMFALIDLLLLTLFFSVTTWTVHLALLDMIKQFMIPLNVTACICLGTLSCRRFQSEYVAVGFCLVWAGIWYRIVCSETLYPFVSTAVWIGLLFLTLGGIFLAGRQLMKTSRECLEERLLWN